MPEFRGAALATLTLLLSKLHALSHNLSLCGSFREGHWQSAHEQGSAGEYAYQTMLEQPLSAHLLEKSGGDLHHPCFCLSGLIH